MFATFPPTSSAIISLDLKLPIECIEIFFVSNKKLMKNSLTFDNIIWDKRYYLDNEVDHCFV